MTSAHYEVTDHDVLIALCRSWMRSDTSMEEAMRALDPTYGWDNVFLAWKAAEILERDYLQYLRSR